MTIRSSVARDVVKYLTDNLPANGPYYPDEWGKDADGYIDKQIMIADGVGELSDIPQYYERPMFTVNFRGDKDENSKTAYDNALVVHDFLVNTNRVTINGIDYSYFDTFAPLQQLERDDESRWILFARYLTLRNTDQVV